MTTHKIAEWYNPLTWASGGADWAANSKWDGMNDQERTNFAADQYMNQRNPGFFSGMMSDQGKADLKSRMTAHMTPGRMMGGGFQRMLGMQPGSTAGSMLKGWKTYAPLAAGAASGLYGLATGNRAAMLAGLGGVGYGLYDAYKATQTLQDRDLLGSASGATSTSNLDRDSARAKMTDAFHRAAPMFQGAKALGLSKFLTKKSSFSDRFRANFQMSELLEEIKNDRSVDPRTAAELIVAGKRAQRMDNRPSSVINVGEFAQAAAKGFGFELGRNIGSLLTLAPAVKSTIRRIGFGGLFSGAKALGVL